MHVVAARPRFLNQDATPAEVLAKEEDILAEEARQSGKKEEMVARIVGGKIGKFFPLKENFMKQQ